MWVSLYKGLKGKPNFMNNAEGRAEPIYIRLGIQSYIMKISIKNLSFGGVSEYAKKELLFFLKKYSSVILCSDSSELNFILTEDTALEEHCYKWEKRGDTITLIGGSQSSLLCCVYELLSKMGICFTTEGDSLKSKEGFNINAITQDSSFSPYCRNRGIRQHINFPMDISSYSLKQAKEYIQNLARIKMNAITLHSYNGQWHSCRKDSKLVRAGHFFYGQRHPLPKAADIAAAIDNICTYCIPEAEGLLEDEEKRERYAFYWLDEVINTAKEAGMTVTFSVECQELTPLEDEKDMVKKILKLYRGIDILELVTPEGGGDDSKTLTGEQAVALSERLFGKEVTADTLRTLTKNGVPPYGGNPTYALDGTLRSIKQIYRMWEDWEAVKSEFPDKRLRVGLYVTCKETLRVAKELMNRIFPKELNFSFLPSHGALAVAEAVEHMEFSEAELQKTMLYSWAEFDGNMYIQQNSCNGIQRLLEICRSVTPAESIYGICFNHWRTAENSFTISYAGEAAHSFIDTKTFYQDYARNHLIGFDKRFVQAMETLAELDVFNRDNLFNIGFCYLGCWLNPKGLGWIRGWSAASIAHSISVYRELKDSFSLCLEATVSSEGLGRLRLLINRCACSIEHLSAIAKLNEIAAFTDDTNPGALSDIQKAEVKQCCKEALDYCERYERLHIQELPDRGCEGTIVSYCETIPVYIDHIMQYFTDGEETCSHRPPSLDEPPPPDTAFFN